MLMPMPKMKVSDISPTTLRLPPALRSALQREAVIRGSSLSQEIIRRLLESAQLPAAAKALTTGEGPPPPSFDLVAQLGDSQRLLLRLFSELPPDKQDALLRFLGR